MSETQQEVTSDAVQALKAAAHAAHAAQYGEKVADCISTLASTGFRAAALIAALRKAPPPVQVMALTVLTDFSSRLAAYRAAELEVELGTELSKEDFNTYLELSQKLTDEMMELMLEGAEQARQALIVPSHIRH